MLFGEIKSQLTWNHLGICGLVNSSTEILNISLSFSKELAVNQWSYNCLMYINSSQVTLTNVSFGTLTCKTVDSATRSGVIVSDISNGSTVAFANISWASATLTVTPGARQIGVLCGNVVESHVTLRNASGSFTIVDSGTSESYDLGLFGKFSASSTTFAATLANISFRPNVKYAQFVGLMGSFSAIQSASIDNFTVYATVTELTGFNGSVGVIVGIISNHVSFTNIAIYTNAFAQSGNAGTLIGRKALYGTPSFSMNNVYVN